MEEVWKPVKDFEELYAVSNLGQVKRLQRQNYAGNGKMRTIAEQIMQQDERGMVSLFKEGKYHKFYVRSLVGESFLNIPYGEDITHMNGDLLDSSVNNLMSTEQFRKYSTDWRDIPGWEGSYQVSRCGQVRSLDRYKYNRQGVLRFMKGVVRELDDAVGGYKQVALYRDGKIVETRHVHIYVARAWIPNPDNKPQVNHKNGIKTDNRVENLEWVTNSENQIHSVRVLGHKPLNPNLNKIGKNNSRSKIILQIKDGKVIKEFYGFNEAYKKTGINKANIFSCVHKHRKTAGGFEWEYKHTRCSI